MIVNLIIKVLFCLFFQLFFDNTDLGNTVTLIIKFTTYNCILEVNYAKKGKAAAE